MNLSKHDLKPLHEVETLHLTLHCVLCHLNVKLPREKKTDASILYLYIVSTQRLLNNIQIIFAGEAVGGLLHGQRGGFQPFRHKIRIRSRRSEPQKYSSLARPFHHQKGYSHGPTNSLRHASYSSPHHRQPQRGPGIADRTA